MDRAALKERAKFKTRNNYWKTVLVAFVLTLIAGGSAGFNLNINLDSDTLNISAGEIIGDPYSFYDGSAIRTLTTFTAVFFIIFFLISIVGTALKIFIFQPVQVGGARFFLENVYRPAEPGKLGFAFSCGHYKNIVLVMFWQQLHIFLWSLLCIIPGIIKAYEYRMVPYLLADAPDLSKEDALRISRQMMDGYKMEAFVLDLSFLGWNMLDACTCGILGIFYVNPYIHATEAEFFVELRNRYFYYAQQNMQN